MVMATRQHPQKKNHGPFDLLNIQAEHSSMLAFGLALHLIHFNSFPTCRTIATTAITSKHRSWMIQSFTSQVHHAAVCSVCFMLQYRDFPWLQLCTIHKVTGCFHPVYQVYCWTSLIKISSEADICIFFLFINEASASFQSKIRL